MVDIPFSFAQHNGVVPGPDGRTLLVRKGAPLAAVLSVRRALEGYPAIESVTPAQFDQALARAYGDRKGSSAEAMENVEELMGLDEAAAALRDAEDLLSADDEAPIIRLLNSILFEALKEHASDIHIEPYENNAAVRFRLDGVLHTVLTPPVAISSLLVSRIKVLSRLDIAEKRIPQDGRMTVRLGGRGIDLRVSTLPSSFGERVVLRLLDKEAGQLSLEDLGMSDADRARLESLINRPHGIILVTGPTGSGKTTTLYAALQHMDRQQRNIMTVEDPVEYNLPGISQTGINLKTGMTFAKGLRAILRQDPDVILVGEIRDRETAEIATQASLTGHLVLSTLHTNTAAGAITRLQDLGIDSFLLASTIRGVLAQRLVRRLCLHCRAPQAPDAVARSLLGLAEGGRIHSAVGCPACNHTGFQGRQGLFELVILDEQMQQMVHDRVGEVELERYIRVSVPSVADYGFDLVRRGVTTLEEVLRVTSA